MSFYKHAQAIVESDSIGVNTRIWAFAHILPGARIGSECNICDHVFVENDVVIGDRVTIKCGVQLWDGIVVEDDVFIGPNATFVNDPSQSSIRFPEERAKTIIRKGASIGANATVLGGITVGRNAMIGAGAVVVRNVPPNAIVDGNPAVIKGYVNSKDMKDPVEASASPLTSVQKTKESIVSGVKIFKLPFIEDMRGNLSFAEYGQLLPFLPKRYFLVFDVPSREIRGEHAHRELHQFLVCVKGSCSVVVDDGKNREEILLDRKDIGIYIPPRVWGIQYKYSRDAVLLVLASDVYRADDYIRDYDEFLAMVNEER